MSKLNHDFVLLDRSGSMITMWAEAITSINAYVAGLVKEGVDTGVTLVTFDAWTKGFEREPYASFDVLRDKIIPSTWKNVEPEESNPRGGTPLNDSIAKIVQRAKDGDYEKVALIIVTDGNENQSVEFAGRDGQAKIKALLDECRAKGWQVIFIGANFDNAKQAESLGTSVHQHTHVAPGNMEEAMFATANLRGTYAKTGANMDYSNEMKAQLSVKKPVDAKDAPGVVLHSPIGGTKAADGGTVLSP